MPDEQHVCRLHSDWCAPCAGTLSWLPSVVANQIGGAIAELLKSLLSSPSHDSALASTSVTQFNRAGEVVDALRLQTIGDQQLLTTAVAGPIAGALVGSVQQGIAPPEAASLLASLVKQFGAGVMRTAPAVALPGAGRTTGTMLLQLLAVPGRHGYMNSWFQKLSRAARLMPCVVKIGKEKSMMRRGGTVLLCQAAGDAGTYIVAASGWQYKLPDSPTICILVQGLWEQLSATLCYCVLY